MKGVNIVKKEKKNNNSGLLTLVICGLLAMAIIVACVFFPEQIFGIFTK